MLVRIVKLTFREDEIDTFLNIFKPHRVAIEKFDGFISLELLREKSNSKVFFTHSHWQNEAALENYRQSVYFREIWSKTKVLFADRPEAWSTQKV